MSELENMIEYAKTVLSEKRYYHSVCVMKKAEEIARMYGEDVGKAKKCGILHDIAKEMSKEELLKYSKENGLEVNDVEELKPGLLHGKVAGDIAKKKYNIDNDMTDAIAYHTTGKENMSLLTKIIYISDAISEDRKYDNVNTIYEICKKSIDEACLLLMDLTIKDKIDEKKLIHENTIKARNYILKNK